MLIKRVPLAIVSIAFLIVIGYIQGYALVPANDTVSYGSVRLYPGENVALLTNFSVSKLANKDRLSFTKHPSRDSSSITIYIRRCNGSQDKLISKCTILSSNRSCSIEQLAFSNEVSLCVFAYSTSSSLPVVEYRMVYEYLSIRTKTSNTLSTLYLLGIIFSIIYIKLLKKNTFRFNIIYILLALFSFCVTYSMIASDLLSLL